MSDQWYYGYGKFRNGPVTSTELRALVESGRIQPGDMIWREGIAEGVRASQVKNLFPPDVADVLPEIVQPGEPGRSSPEMLSLGSQPELKPAGSVEPPPSPESPKAEKPPVRPAPPVKKGRAIGAKGAIILGQDGVTVRYRKKCIKCGYEENSTNRMPIKNGTTRVSFFCRQCRKLQPVEIQGSM